jgi:hypothetical protein
MTNTPADVPMYTISGLVALDEPWPASPGELLPEDGDSVVGGRRRVFGDANASATESSPTLSCAGCDAFEPQRCKFNKRAPHGVGVRVRD